MPRDPVPGGLQPPEKDAGGTIGFGLEFRWRDVISLGEDAPRGDSDAENRPPNLFVVAEVCEVGG